MALEGFLHHLYHFRMDDPTISSLSAAHLHRSMCGGLGPDSVSASCGFIVRISLCVKDASWYQRGCIWAWSPFLSFLLLQTRRASFKNGSLHLRCSISNFLRSKPSLGHHKAVRAHRHCTMAHAVLGRGIPERRRCRLCVVLHTR